MSVEYIDRSLVYSPFCIGLCINEKEWNKEVKRLNIKNDKGFMTNKYTRACITFFENKELGLISIICIKNKKSSSIEETHSFLIHECIHLWQEIKKHIGEDNPGYEIEAYIIQNLCFEIMNLYRRKTEDKKMKHTMVKSSNVKSIAYENGVMHVVYSSGDAYEFKGVSEEDHKKLMAAKSIGSHLHKMGIKGTKLKKQ
jgi:hypothetical protein